MKGATSLLMKAQVIADNIDTADDYANAIDFRKTLKAGIAEREAAFAEPKQKAFEAHRAVCDLEKRVIEPLRQADKIIQEATIAWKVDQDRIAKERQAELDRIAREQEEARRAAIAEELKAAGPVGEAQAEALLAQPVTIRSVQVVQEAAPKVEGVSYVKTYEAVIEDPEALWRGVLDGRVPRAILAWDLKFLGKQADLLKLELNYPGVRVIEKTTDRISTRGRGR